MIIYDGEKYACVSCIRGHRSSTCRHTNRMLVKVRNRGRHGSLDIRKVIIVDADSQVQSEEKSPSCDNCIDSGATGDGKECEKMNKQPILFLKTVRTQNAVLSEGKLKIIVEDNGDSCCGNGNGLKDVRPGFKYVTEKEFLRQHCIDLANSEVGDSCGCKSKGLPLSVMNQQTSTPDPAMKLEYDELAIPKLGSSELSASISESKLGNDFRVSSDHNQTPISEQSVICNTSNNIGVDAEASANLLANGIVRNDNDNYHIDNASIHAILNQKPMVELLTHKGLYLSTQCSCADDSCLCANCLLHRNEQELSSYIQQSGVPLTNLGEAQLANSVKEPECAENCRCSDIECACHDCLDHPTDILSFNRLLFNGILNVPLKRKTVINYKGRLIPSHYWWDFLKFQVPLMTASQLDTLDMIAWFDSIISTYPLQLMDANAFNVHADTSIFGL
ncbi:hypothetical protein HG535_0G03500 [Zygotorulaspora mrakii]|uniref:Copper-fist domain-containing protein n=1 Tax=Zygotorulaspora mrakii TaxID=42260 RepID=A0A7H9B7A2_ZYGMR|nr:uncharacterized protein HG535_0G03500 [Zygotorulaspora mrakii]QLG74467.1 hypothetical protein HG535_0G03500 [Zygotorulaspora mrakii]